MVLEILSDIRILLYQKLAIYELIKVRRFLTLSLILMVRYDLIIIWYHVRLFFFKCLVRSNPRIGDQTRTYQLIKVKPRPDESDTTEDTDADGDDYFDEFVEDNACYKNEGDKTASGNCKRARGDDVKFKNTQPKGTMKLESESVTGHNSCCKKVVADIPLDDSKAITSDNSDNDGNKDCNFHGGTVYSTDRNTADYYSGTDTNVCPGCNTRTTTIDSSGSLDKGSNFNIKLDGSHNSGINILINLGKENVNIRIFNEKMNISICKDENVSINTNKDKEPGCNIDVVHSDKIVNRNIEKCPEEIANLTTEVITETIDEAETIPSISTDVTNEPIEESEPIPSFTTEVIAEPIKGEETAVNPTTEFITEAADDAETLVNRTTEVAAEVTKEAGCVNNENVYAPNFKFTPDQNLNLRTETINRFGEAFIRGVKFQRRQQSFFPGEEYFRGGYHNPESDESQSLFDIFNNIFPAFNKIDEHNEKLNDTGSGGDKAEDEPEIVAGPENSIEGDDCPEKEAIRDLDDEEERSDDSESETKSLDCRKESEANDVSDVEFGYNPKNIFDNYENFRADYFKGDPKYDYIHYSDSEYDYTHREDRSRKKQPKFHRKRDHNHLKGDLGALAVVRRIYKLRRATLDQHPSGYIRIGTRDVHFADLEKEIERYGRHFQKFPIKDPEDAE
ncbi:hypothetical protein MACJ_002305 [Theileria orientalis]|uniref:Uncharacterized protein n=1 Tax=Theileria orientalis TaxID=68886 RepID=A0A976M5X2_THEOR|nr:hypothetical protein MACJ_002305 [Theileria orientalis]